MASIEHQSQKRNVGVILPASGGYRFFGRDLSIVRKELSELPIHFYFHWRRYIEYFSLVRTRAAWRGGMSALPVPFT
jgi:hypothetical protein